MIIDQPLQGKRSIQLLRKHYATETLRVIRSPRGLYFKPVTPGDYHFSVFFNCPSASRGEK